MGKGWKHAKGTIATIRAREGEWAKDKQDTEKQKKIMNNKSYVLLPPNARQWE